MLELEKIKCEFCEKKMEWIPCSERLPEESKEYLASLKGGWVEIVWYNKEQNEFNNDVIAWMSLPEPYEGEAHE